MGSEMDLILPITPFLILLFLGMPVAFAMGISGIFGLLLTLAPMATLGLLDIQPLRTAASYTPTTIAMFVLLAEFAAQSSITQRPFEADNPMVGPVKGGWA